MKRRMSIKQKLHTINLKAEKALKEAVAEVVKDHLRTGDPLVVWRNGKVVWLPPAKAKRILKAS